MENNHLELIAKDTNKPSKVIKAVIKLLEEGASLPFIARYRKDMTGGLDEIGIKEIQDRVQFYKEITARKKTILKTISDLGKLDPKLEEKISSCFEKVILEDIYLPFKPKKKNKADTALEKGLGRLAKAIIYQNRDGSLNEALKPYINPKKEILNSDDAITFANYIVSQRISEDQRVRRRIRSCFWEYGELTIKISKGIRDEKLENYKPEKVKKIPAHRFYALKRDEKEGKIKIKISYPETEALREIQNYFRPDKSSCYFAALNAAIKEAYKKSIYPSIEKESFQRLKESSDKVSAEFFSKNLNNILMEAPFGTKLIFGIDPGFKTGCKCAVVDSTGKFLDYVTLYPFSGDNALKKSEKDLLAFIRKYRPKAIAIGNKTAGRETLSFVKALLSKDFADIKVISVNEDGVSVFSASEESRKEFPDLDLTIRGAISIARRLQDPLAELVKVNPKNLGIGQYQHDLDQKLLDERLDLEISSAVNSVGVNLNTASHSLLSKVSGIGPSLAKKIVIFREENGLFSSRKELMKVPSFGKKVFEQGAAFLRVSDAKNPLDNSAVHPEAYNIVNAMAKEAGYDLKSLVGSEAAVSKINWKKHLSEQTGELYLKDLISELKKPGRDPRKNFENTEFSSKISEITDLKAGMKINGVVSNVTAFGAFVDLGIKENGLIHISQIADKFVKDPGEIVHIGMKLKVRVLDVDLNKKRIALSLKKEV